MLTLFKGYLGYLHTKEHWCLKWENTKKLLETVNPITEGYSYGKRTLGAPALTKNVNINIWVVCTSNQLLIRGS